MISLHAMSTKKYATITMTVRVQLAYRHTARQDSEVNSAPTALPTAERKGKEWRGEQSVGDRVIKRKAHAEIDLSHNNR